MLLLVRYCVWLQTQLENELQKQKGKVQSLQIDLDNSEAVQRDFVKLSQSLQVIHLCNTSLYYHNSLCNLSYNNYSRYAFCNYCVTLVVKDIRDIILTFGMKLMKFSFYEHLWDAKIIIEVIHIRFKRKARNRHYLTYTSITYDVKWPFADTTRED